MGKTSPISLDPIRFNSGDQNHYRWESNNPILRLDSLGLKAGDITVWVDAFIHEGRGDWLPEPGSTEWYFNTNRRDWAWCVKGFDTGAPIKNSKLYSMIDVDWDKFTALACNTNQVVLPQNQLKGIVSQITGSAGSERRRLIDFNDGKPNYEVQQKDVTPKSNMIVSGRGGAAAALNVTLTASAGYAFGTEKTFGIQFTPFGLFQIPPDIDYTIILSFEPNKDGTIYYDAQFVTDSFPDCEMYINKMQVFKMYPTADKGPTIVNLNTQVRQKIESGTIKKN